MENDVIALKEQMKTAFNRIEGLEETTKRIESLTLSVEKLAMSVEVMAKEQVDYRNQQNELAKRILTVEQAPFKEKASKLDTIMLQIVTLTLGALVGYVLTNVFGL